MKNGVLPRVLLVGAGRFGVNYIRILKKFQEKGVIDFAGVLVKTNESVKKISKEYKINAWNNIDDGLIEKLDAVIIVTPPETHYPIIERFIKHTNIFVEKPLTNNYELANELYSDAKKYSKILMVGHLFRFHPVIKEIKKIFFKSKEKPNLIKGKFTNPITTDNGRNISLEMLHLYDIIDYLFVKLPSTSVAQVKGRTNLVSLRYPNNMDAILEIGWKGDKRARTINFYFKDKNRIFCDLDKNIIEIFKLRKSREKIIDKTCEKVEEELIKRIECKRDVDILEEEILTFINVLQKKLKSYPDGKVGARIVKVATSINFIPKENKPKVAIIGAGIFGANCAIQLGKFCDVTLFERNSNILSEASFINQYRHHEGFHYPRSQETVEDIREAKKSFEFYYNKAIIRNFPTYYSVAKEGSRVSAEDYIKFCKDNNFSFSLEHPHPEHVDRNRISVSLKTLEPIYNYPILYDTVKSYLYGNNNIKIMLNSEIIKGNIEKDGKKILVIKNNDKVYKDEYDFVINITYANLNKFAYWFNFPIKLLRIDLVEALIVKVPIPRISFAIMDGPFTNLVPTSEDNRFTLVHIKDSMLKRGVPKDGLIPESWKKIKSNKKKILRESEKWLPILNKAEVVESRYVFRGVNAYREHDDARPSDIIYHGFGCWSILGGKIINCVDTAIKIADEIKQK